MRKEDYVQRWLRSMVRSKRYGVYFIFKSMEQGPTFRCAVRISANVTADFGGM